MQAGDKARADPYDRPGQDEYDRTVTAPYDAATSSSAPPGPVTGASDTPASLTAASVTDDAAAIVSARTAALPGSTVARSEPPARAASPAGAAAAPADRAGGAAQFAPSGQPAEDAEPPTAQRAAGTERVFPDHAPPARRPAAETSQLIDGIEHNAAAQSTPGAERAFTSEQPFAMYPHESSQLTGGTQPTAAQPTAVVKGRVHIEDTVIEKVAALASQDVTGVAGVGGYATRVPEPARDRPGIGSMPRVHGARARIEDRQAWVDVVIVIEYGAVVMEVANAVKANVAHALSHMLGLRVAEVNVTITDVEMPRTARPGAHAVGATDASRP